MAETLEDMMIEKGMTRYRLSKESGIPWATLSDICTGKTDMEKCSAGTIRKLSRALGITMEETMDLETGEISQTRLDTDDYLECGIPTDLRKAIDDYLNRDPLKDAHIEDCLLDEIYGSINANYHAGRITEEQARYLRSKYLGDGDD